MNVYVDIYDFSPEISVKIDCYTLYEKYELTQYEQYEGNSPPYNMGAYSFVAKVCREITHIFTHKHGIWSHPQRQRVREALSL